MTWRPLAACAKEPKWVQDLFFSPEPYDTHRAKSVCAGCNVVEECLTYAMEMNMPDGVWGMHSTDERRMVRRGNGSIVAAIAAMRPTLNEHAFTAEHSRRALPAPYVRVKHP